MKKPLSFLFAVFAALLMTGSAFAADGPAAGGGDISVKFLSGVFGELFGGSGGGPVAGIISQVNLFCLTCAGFMLAYTIFRSVLMTAHDGEFFGKDGSAVWTPIKTLLGVGLVVPLGSGYCAAQYILAWIILQGISVANGVFGTYAETMQEVAQSSNETLPVSVSRSKVEALAYDMMNALNCQAANENAAGQLEGFKTTAKTTGDYTTERKFGVNGFADNSCGSITAANINKQTNIQAAYRANNEIVKAFDYDTSGIAQKFSQAHAQASMAMEASLRPIAARAQKGQLTAADKAAVNNAIDAYMNAVQTTSGVGASTANIYKDVQKTAQNGGFFAAGAVFTKSIAAGSANASGSDAVPTANNSGNGDGVVNSADVSNGQAAIDGNVGNGDGGGMWDSVKNAVSSTWTKVKQKWSDVNDWIRKGSELNVTAYLNKKCAEAAQGLFDMLTGASSGGNFFAAMSNLGGKMMTAGSVMLLGGVIIDAWFHSDAMLLIGIGVTMIGTGAIISIVLGMMPFFIYLGACVGWLGSVCLAVLGIPLWAMMLCAPGKHELHHSAHGLKKAIALALKPAALVFGFTVAASVYDGISGYLSSVFFSVATAASGSDGIKLLLATISLVMVYIGVQVKLLHQIFAFPGIFCDTIDNWLDVAGSGMSAQGAAGMTSAGAAASGGIAATSAAMQGPTQGTANAVGNKVDSLRGKEDKGGSGSIKNASATSGKAGDMQEKSKAGGSGGAGKDAKPSAATNSAGEMQEKGKGGSGGAAGGETSGSGETSGKGNEKDEKSSGRIPRSEPGFFRNSMTGAASAAGRFSSSVGDQILGGHSGGNFDPIASNSAADPKMRGGRTDDNDPNSGNNPKNARNFADDEESDDANSSNSSNNGSNAAS